MGKIVVVLVILASTIGGLFAIDKDETTARINTVYASVEESKVVSDESSAVAIVMKNIDNGVGSIVDEDGNVYLDVDAILACNAIVVE